MMSKEKTKVNASMETPPSHCPSLFHTSPSFFPTHIPIVTLLPWIHLTLPFHTMMNTILPVKLPTTIQ